MGACVSGVGEGRLCVNSSWQVAKGMVSRNLYSPGAPGGWEGGAEGQQGVGGNRENVHSCIGVHPGVFACTIPVCVAVERRHPGQQTHWYLHKWVLT